MTGDPIHVGRYEGPHAPMTGRWVCADNCQHPDHQDACTGDVGCPASPHLHGCHSDHGNCEAPFDHLGSGA